MRHNGAVLTVDVGHCFVYGSCVPLPYCFSHAGRIFSYVSSCVYSDLFLKTGLAVGWFPLLVSICLGSSSSPGNICDRAAEYAFSSEVFLCEASEERWAVGVYVC